MTPNPIKPKFNLRREPKGIASFKERYAARLKPTTGLFGERYERKRVGEVVSYIKELVGEHALKKQGEGVQLIFPFTSALGHGEFVKGVLKVIAPKTRVIFLVTPEHTNFISLPPRNIAEKERRERANANLSKHVKKSIRPNMKTLVVDDYDTKASFHAIAKSLQEVGINEKEVLARSDLEIGDFILDYYPNEDLREHRRKINLGWKKEPEGKYALDNGNWERQIGVRTFGRGIYTPPTLGRSGTKESNIRRRMLYNLGIATAKEYLKVRQRRA